MKFDKSVLIDLLYGDYDNDGMKKAYVIENELISNDRWSLHYRMIFKYADKYYETFYSRGATEYQDEQPYEFEDDMIECDEVVPVEKTITVYERR